MDDGGPRFRTGTKIYKMFDGLEYSGIVTGYDTKSKLYHIKYEDDDIEDFYHNEVRDQLRRTVPKKLRWENQRRKRLQGLDVKLAPMESDISEYVMALPVETIRSIASIKSGLDCSEITVPHNLVKMAIQTLTSNAMTD